MTHTTASRATLLAQRLATAPMMTRSLDVNPPTILLCVFVAVSALSMTIYLTGAHEILSPYITIPLALLEFSLVPGFLLQSLLQMFRPSRYGFHVLLLLSTSLGFTTNFLVNVVVFVVNPDIHQIVHAYVIVVFASYSAMLGKRIFAPTEQFVYRHSVRPAFVIIIGILIAVLCVLILHRDPPYYYIEEIIVLRKLVGLSNIHFDQLGYLPGERTTYIFVPFYLFVSMVSTFLNADPLVGYIAVWPFTAMISIGCTIQILYFIAGDRRAAVLVLLLACCAATFWTVHPSVWRVDLIPPPDRYAVAAGVLLPLALFHFFAHINDENFNVAMLIGLVYLIVENTFVHAKETLYVLAIFCVYIVVLLSERRIDWIKTKRALVVIALVVALVAGYAAINALTNPELSMHLATARNAFVAAIVDDWDRAGVWSLFEAASTIGYRQATSWPLFRGDAAWMYLVFAALPFYVSRMDRPEAIFLPLAISVLLLVSASRALVNLVGTVVGEQDFFRFGATITFIALAIGIHMAFLTIRHAIRLATPIVAGQIALDDLPFYLKTFILALMPTWTARLAAMFSVAVLVAILIRLAEAKGASIVIETFTITGLFAMDILLFTTVAAIGFARIRGWHSPLILGQSSMLDRLRISWRTALSGAIVVLLVIGAGWLGRQTIERNRSSPPQVKLHIDSFALRNLGEHDVGLLLAQLDKISNRYFSVQGFKDYRPFFFSIDGRAQLPPSVIRAASALPPALNWIGDETMTIIASAPQYASAVTSDGILYGGWSKNCFLLNKLLNTKKECIYDMLLGQKFGLPFLFDTLGESGLLKFIQDEKIDVIIAGPHTYEKSKAILQLAPRLAYCFDKTFDADRALLLLKRSCP